MCVLFVDLRRRLPLEVRCSLYQRQQADVNLSVVRGSYETRFRGGQNLAAMERNASVYQLYRLNRITGEGRAEV